MSSTPTAFQMSVPADTSELDGLRRRVGERACELGAEPHLVEDFLLVVSELATNVIMHTADHRIEVGVTLDESYWVIDVAGADGLVDGAPRSLPDACQVGGRGLFIVDAVMDAVAVVPGPTGQFVRCLKFASV